MRSNYRFVSVLAFSTALIILAYAATEPGSAQEQKNAGLRLSVIGIGVRDYPESQNFYETIMGLPVAFKFSNQDGTRTTTYYQLSRDTFLEMQPVMEGVAPGFTHIHLVVDDVAAAVARFRRAGLGIPARGAMTPMTVSEPGVAQPSNVKNANIYDPNGLRLELNELIPGSLTRKATDAWGNRTGGYRLSVIGFGVRNYAESQNFDEKIMGFPVAFKFGTAERPTTYYQMNRDTFLELQTTVGDATPGFTHVHLVVDDLNSTVARLRQAGLASAARTTTTPATVTEPGVAMPSNVKSANVFDPNGLRLELNELIPESLTKKAADAWK
jgi:catechol 2,3-dioxygenase-like lactoylglutathione lyase family enzyme